MKTNVRNVLHSNILHSKFLYNKFLNQWGKVASLFVLAVLVTSCGGGEAAVEPTEVPAAATSPATNVPQAQSESQSESPLAQSESPLAQPESPLTKAPVDVAVPQSEEEAIELAANTRAAEPTEGFGTLSGLLYSFGTDKVVPGTQVYLTLADEVEGKPVPPSVYFGPQPEQGDIYGFSNDAGQVHLEKIPPGNYYLAVWTVYDWLLAFPEAEESIPLLITIEEGDQLELGMLYVNWP